MRVKRAVVFELNHLSEEQQIILGHLTYHAGRLWNQANYLVKNKLTKSNYRDLYHKLKDTSLHLRSLQYRVVTWDKTGFKIEGSRIRLSISKSLKEHLLKKFGFSFDYLWVETGYKDLRNLKIFNVQVVPYKSYDQISFKVVVVYEREISEVKPEGNKVLAIDIEFQTLQPA